MDCPKGSDKKEYEIQRFLPTVLYKPLGIYCTLFLTPYILSYYSFLHQFPRVDASYPPLRINTLTVQFVEGALFIEDKGSRVEVFLLCK